MASPVAPTGQGISKEQVEKLREAIGAKIKSLGIGEQVRELLAESLRERGGAGGAAFTREEAMDVLQQRGLVDQLVMALGRPVEVTGAAQGLARSTKQKMSRNKRYLMVRLCNARGFLMHTSAPPHEGERLVISGMVHGQRIRSAAVPSCEEPSFNETALVELPGARTDGGSELHALAIEYEPLHLVRRVANGQGFRFLGVGAAGHARSRGRPSTTLSPPPAG